MKFLKKCFIIGLIAAILLGLIYWALKFIWNIFSPFKLFSTLIFGKHIFGLEIVIALIFIIIVGFLINLWEKKSGPIKQKTVIHKILNFFHAIKNTVSRWLDASQPSRGIYVAVEIAPGVSALGMTSYNTFRFNNYDKDGKYLLEESERIAVSLVSWPFPTTGPLIVFVQRDKIQPLDKIPPEIIVQLIMTATILKFKDEDKNKAPSN